MKSRVFRLAHYEESDLEVVNSNRKGTHAKKPVSTELDTD